MALTRDDVCGPAAADAWATRACLRLEVAGPGTDLLPSPAARPDHIWRGVDEGVFAYGYREGGRWWMRWPAVGTFLIRPDSPAVTVTAEPGVDRPVIDDAFDRAVRPIALMQREFEVLHASAVATSRGVVALCAVSGTGKSTVAAALTGVGLERWADDFVALHMTGEGAWCPYLPSRTRLDAPAAAAIAALSSTPAPPGDRSSRSGARLQAVLILRRDPGLPAALAVGSPLLPSQAFTALLPHSHESPLADDDRLRRSLERYLDLAASVPVIEVRLRPGLSRLAEVAGKLADFLQTFETVGVP
jgi:hypothetical protein